MGVGFSFLRLFLSLPLYEGLDCGIEFAPSSVSLRPEYKGYMRLYTV